MNQLIKIPSRKTIEECIYIYTKIDELNKIIAEDDKNNFNFEFNNFENKIIKHTHTCFYIRPYKGILPQQNLINLEECPVCYINILPFNTKHLNCKHVLCNLCYHSWNNTCDAIGIQRSCPECRVEY